MAAEMTDRLPRCRGMAVPRLRGAFLSLVVRPPLAASARPLVAPARATAPPACAQLLRDAVSSPLRSGVAMRRAHAHAPLGRVLVVLCSTVEQTSEQCAVGRARGEVRMV